MSCSFTAGTGRLTVPIRPQVDLPKAVVRCAVENELQGLVKAVPQLAQTLAQQARGHEIKHSFDHDLKWRESGQRLVAELTAELTFSGTIMGFIPITGIEFTLTARFEVALRRDREHVDRLLAQVDVKVWARDQVVDVIRQKARDMGHQVPEEDEKACRLAQSTTQKQMEDTGKNFARQLVQAARQGVQGFTKAFGGPTCAPAPAR